MVQEVQTQGNRYQEPNLIPGVGISERKVKEHVQITQSFGYECVVSAAVGLSADSDHRQSADTRGDFTLNSQSGNTEFRIINGRLRIPLAGAYLAELSFLGGSGGATFHHKIRIGSKTILTQNTNDNIDAVNITKVFNLGRYDLLEFRTDLYRNGSGGYSGTGRLTMRLKKL